MPKSFGLETARTLGFVVLFTILMLLLLPVYVRAGSTNWALRPVELGPYVVAPLTLLSVLFEETVRLVAAFALRLGGRLRTALAAGLVLGVFERGPQLWELATGTLQPSLLNLISSALPISLHGLLTLIAAVGLEKGRRRAVPVIFVGCLLVHVMNNAILNQTGHLLGISPAYIGCCFFLLLWVSIWTLFRWRRRAALNTSAVAPAAV